MSSVPVNKASKPLQRATTEEIGTVGITN